MKRQIKFRIWDKRSNRWLTRETKTRPHPITREEREVVVYTDEGTYVSFEVALARVDLFETQQFTNLLDKNGKDLYEGDIVEYVEGIELGDKSREVAIVKYDEYFGCFGYADSLDEDCKNYPWEGTVSRPTIIGNILENPDLLHEKK